MKRDIEWVDRLDDGMKRKVRVKFPGHDQIKWQFKRADEELWDYNSVPSDVDWAHLEEKIDALYHRRRAPYKHLELVQKKRKEASD